MPPQVATLLETFIDAGGTSDVLVGLAKGDIGRPELNQLWQTGHIWDEVYREGPANLIHRDGDYPDGDTLINYAQANYANANYANAEDRSDTPLEQGELNVMRSHLETLKKGRPLSDAQMAELLKYIARFNKFPPKATSAEQLDQLQKLLGLLNDAIDKLGGPAKFGVLFDYLDSMLDVLTSLLGACEENSYEQFKLLMANRGGQDPRQYYEANRDGWPGGFIEKEKFWIRWLIDQAREKLKNKRPKPQVQPNTDR